MNPNTETLKKLIHKYLENEISQEEYHELWVLLNAYPNEEPLDEELFKLWQATKNAESVIQPAVWDHKMQLGKENLMANVQDTKAVIRPSFFRRYRWRVASAVLLIVSTSVVIYITNDKKEIYTNNTKHPKQDRLPGGDKAVLTLSDGRTIVLDSAYGLVEFGRMRVNFVLLLVHALIQMLDKLIVKLLGSLIGLLDLLQDFLLHGGEVLLFQLGLLRGLCFLLEEFRDRETKLLVLFLERLMVSRELVEFELRGVLSILSILSRVNDILGVLHPLELLLSLP